VLVQRPDVAIVDVGLPGMNGYDIARSIRARLPEGAIRLIALTGYGQPADRERALAAGFDAHLLKPIAPEALQLEVAR
jgi:CheY-like chemotaxis protein